MVKLDTKYCRVPFRTINLVRKLKINRRPSKLDLQCQPISQSRINTKNLVNIDISPKKHTTTNNLKIATINARSIKNKVELVLENSELESIDVLAITETWLTDSQEDQAWVQTSGLQDDEHSFHMQNRQDKKGGGLGLWHRKEYQATRIDHNHNYTTLEQAGWSLQIGDRILTILVIYHPPGNTHTRLLDEVSQLVQYYMTNHKNLVILGDFNIAVQDLNNPDSIAFYNTMEALGLVQHIDKPTHQLGNTLDHIYTESLDQLGVQHAFIGPYLSDHRLVGIEINARKHIKHLEDQHRWPLKELDIDTFKKEFRNETIIQHSNLDTIWKEFNRELTRTLDKLAPLRKPRKNVKPPKPWYNSRLLGQRRIVRTREDKYIKYKQNHQWKAFTKERNRYTTMLRFNKRASIVELVYSAQNDCKKLFRLVNKILGKENSNPMPAARKPDQLCEDFATFFKDKIDKIRDRFIRIDPYQPSQLDTPQLDRFTPITPSTLGKIIKRMPPKTCALDAIPTSKLQELLEGCLPTLTHLVNSSLGQGIFCEDWKEAIVKPLIKKIALGMENSNYRPVSNLCFISKVVEKVTLDQFNSHCQEHNLVPEYQSAYRKRHSCETSLVKLVNDILWNMENQLVTAIVILDLSAAFNTVDHDILLEVLEKCFGIVGAARKWYESYLKPRRFKVAVEDKLSQPRQLDYSVPQGSVQGAFLFIAYASTLEQIVDSQLTLNGFADDHSVRLAFKPSKLDHKEELDTIATMEKSMQDIKVWMDQV